MKISLIAAIAEKNRAIGKGNQLIWKIPEDLKRFKEITSGHPIIMGRKTYESIGKPLPGRANIIVTRDITKLKDVSAIKVVSLDDAIEQAEKIEIARIANQSHQINSSEVIDEGEIFIIGGGQVFEQAIKRNLVDKLYLTIIEKEVEGDTFFPEYSSFKKVSESEVKEHNGIKYRFEEWEK